MGIKKYNPTTPSLRQMTVSTFEEIDKVAPEKSLLRPLYSKAGRNANGRITVRHRGGGAKRKYRVIDFKRYKDGMKATVQSIEYDPNRSANIALLQYEDGEKTYIIAPLGLKAGDVVVSGEGSDIKPGNAMEIKDIPVGTLIYNVELYPGKGGQLVRNFLLNHKRHRYNGKPAFQNLHNNRCCYIIRKVCNHMKRFVVKFVFYELFKVNL